MKRILIITAMSAMSMASIAAEMSNRENDGLIVVIGGHEPSLDHTALLPVLTMAEYYPEFTGEVVPEFVPGEAEDVLPGVKPEVFHPPKTQINPFDKTPKPGE